MADELEAHQVVSVVTERPHNHVTIVRTGRRSGAADWHWPIAEVLGALEAGESFYTVSPSTGQRAELEAVDCPVPGCAAKTIRAEPGPQAAGGAT